MKKIKQGLRLKMLIYDAGYSITTFAPLVGMVRETLQRKIGEENLDVDLVAKAAGILNVDAWEITGVMAPSEVNEAGAAYGDGSPEEVTRLRRDVEDLKKLVADLASRDDLSREMMEVIKNLTKPDK